MRLRPLAWLATAVVLLAAPAPASAFLFQESAGPASATNGLVIGPDGNFWAAEQFAGSVVRLSPAGTVLGRFAVGGGPTGMAVGPGGRVWVAVTGADKLVWIDALAAAPTTHDVPTVSDCGPVAIVADGDGRMYYSMPSDGTCNLGASKLGTVSDSGLGPHAAVDFGEVFDLEVTGGKLFAPDFGGDVIHRIALGTSFTVEAAVTTTPGAGPDGVTSDGAGNVWVTLWNAGQVARFPATQNGGPARELFIGKVANPFGIVAAADGRMYVAGKGSANVARIAADGSFQLYGLADSEPFNIINGFDGDVWFSDQRKTRIVRLVNSAPRAATGAASATSPTTASVNASVDPRGNDTQVVFDYGPTAAYGSTSAPVFVPNGATPVDVTGVLIGLSHSTTYHIRARATNGEGAATGADTTFTTPVGLVDADGDGSSPPSDCNDASSAIRPGALDTPGNKVDENCDGVDAPYPKLDSAITYTFAFGRGFTRFTSLSIQPARKGSTVRISCTGRGCFTKARTRKVTKDVRKLSLSTLVRRYRLRAGARLEVRVTKPGTVGVVRRLTVRSRRRSPTRADLCLRPGAKRPARCPL